MTTWKPAGAARATALEVGPIRLSEAHFAPSLALPPHEHVRDTLVVMLSGEFESRGAKLDDYRTGDSLIEPAGDKHCCRFGPAGARVLVLQPSLDDELLHDCRPLFQRRTTLRARSISTAALRIVRELRAPDSTSPLLVEGLALQLLALGSRGAAPAKRERKRPPWLSRTEELLRASFRSSWRMIDLARRAGVHPVHLQRVFRAHNGTTIGDYQRHLRLEWAAQRLAISEEPIVDIAIDAGFSDHSHLDRAFGRRYGCSPRQYRRERRG